MKTDILLSGVGGQGILSIASVIGYAAISNNLHMKQSEVHGMSQRGGAVQSHLRISDQPVLSDLIPYGNADLILSVEPMESLRYLPYLSVTGWLVTNTIPYINIANYPDLNIILSEINKIPNHVTLDANDIAKKSGSLKASNMVILGAASSFIHLPGGSLEESIREVFKSKGEEVVDINLEAFAAGKKRVAKE